MNAHPRVLVIAEAGVNHNGSLERALQLVDAAARAGADVVKFQTFRAEKLASRHAAKAGYQRATTGAEELQLQMLQRLELPADAHRALQERCRSLNIQFLSSAFDDDSISFLVRELGVPMLKIGSGEITNAPLLLCAARYGKPIILSTGMATLDEVEAALGVIAFGYLSPQARPALAAFRGAFGSEQAKPLLRERVTLLHCTTEYPAPLESINLRAMQTLRDAFGLRVGYSDHTLGTTVPIAAAALGATVIEKHFTLDRALPGPDHRASLEPEELTRMVQAIREVELAMGSEAKQPAPSELENRAVARRSLVASRDLREGEVFTEANLAVKRPGNGVSPFNYWDYLGSSARRSYQADELVD